MSVRLSVQRNSQIVETANLESMAEEIRDGKFLLYHRFFTRTPFHLYTPSYPTVFPDLQYDAGKIGED